LVFISNQKLINLFNNGTNINIKIKTVGQPMKIDLNQSLKKSFDSTLLTVKTISETIELVIKDIKKAKTSLLWNSEIFTFCLLKTILPSKN
tara:strand:+ start:260 stop:532 length:273 start_codon:yes stop_codon:yes gene_type:complete